MATSPRVDLDAVARLVDQLEADLARAKAGSTGTDTLRAEVEQLRALLAAEEPAHADVQAGLSGLRERMHALSDELLTDAVRSGDYLARIGRLLGL
ncbi:MAG: hypothetical protein MUC68_18290 [Burkholderiaceae bacterium]|jgi:hypothetical protein|nr:hypothetical protein [Burkholderiaceae bacterium]